MKIIIGIPMNRSSKRAKISQNNNGQDFRNIEPINKKKYKGTFIHPRQNDVKAKISVFSSISSKS